MNIFKSTEEMPSKNSSADVVRTAMTKVEMHENYTPALNIPNKDMSVANLPPVNRGRHY